MSHIRNEQPVSMAIWPSPILQATNFHWGPYNGQTFIGMAQLHTMRSFTGRRIFSLFYQAALVKVLCQSLLDFCKLLRMMDQAWKVLP